MSKKMDRRGFLKALPFLPKAVLEEAIENKDNEKSELSEIDNEVANLIRPPYSDSSSDFSLCSKCDGKCVLECEEKILFRYKDGSPYVSFNGKGCTLCKKCAEACEYDVLSLDKPAKISANFEINTKSCLAWNGVMCFSCKEPCLEDAIKFKGIFNPEINMDLCVGCGFCVPICPTGAISVKCKT